MEDATRITATELARNLSDVLNRVRYRGESFEIVRNGEIVAELRPCDHVRREYTFAEFRRDLGSRRLPVGLAAAIDDAKNALRPLPELPWHC
jgi:prevent-host-death family protein